MVQCDVCGGWVFKFLGMLGSLRHYRCRSCGAECCTDTADADAPVEWNPDTDVDTNYGAW